MIRPEHLALVLLVAAQPAAAEALDAEFVAFLADDAEATPARAPDNELVAWLQDWWTPADTAPQGGEEEKP